MNKPIYYTIPAVTPEALGSAAFRKAYGVRYSYYAGSMAKGISSEDMVIALGRAGYMGSYGSGGMPLDTVERAIDRIKATLPEGPYLFNILHTPNRQEDEEALVSLFLRKSVRAIEASAFIEPTPALIRYRAAGLAADKNGDILAENKIIVKISREECAEKFMRPPDPDITASLLERGFITPEQARWAKETPMADDVTAEADSGGHTDNRPLISLLPLIIAVRDEIQSRFQYKRQVRVGAAGGIGTALSAAAAFLMGADYVATGSVNQACVEAGTSGYVKQMLSKTDMYDVVMAPGADLFESGSRVQVMKKGTMFPMNAQKLYDIYTRCGCLEDIPDNDRRTLETRLFRTDLNTVWDLVKEYFSKTGEETIRRAEANGKVKMALVFRWYLGNSSSWAIRGDMERKMDMQIWCGQSMGAFNRWVKGSGLETAEKRTVTAVAGKIMREAAMITMENCLRYACRID